MPNYAEQVLKIAQNEFKNSKNSSHPDLKKIHNLKADDDGNLKEPFKQLIDKLQLAKYPHPPFTCNQQIIEINDKKIPVTYIKAEGQIHLDDKQLHQVKVTSLLLRKVALAATLEAYATQHVENSVQLQAIRDQLEKLVNKEIEKATKQATSSDVKLDAYKETNEFINDLGNILNNNTQLKNHGEAVRKIKNYERYVLSEMNAGRVIINESTLTTDKGTKNIIQMDIPLDAPLTKAQKDEYLRILSDNKPEWFKKLTPEEQGWYQERVKRANDSPPDGWNNFAQKVYSTSAMQQSLELKNARKNYFFIDNKLQSESTKNATLNPIEVIKEERRALTLQNAEQLIETQIQTAQSHFRAHWGLSPEKPLPGKIMIASQSLLSPLLGKADDKMIEAQKEAIEHYAKDNKYKDYQIVFGNDAVNIFRKLQTINWDYTEKVITYSKDLKTKLQDSGVKSDHPQLKLMNEAIRQLDELKNSPNKSDRNKAAFKTALTSILIEASGGSVSTNCKSGKDRTGLEELYHHAMLTYYTMYDKLPGYNDGPQDRQKFIKIYTHLFNTLKIHESASGNTIGAFGIKDSAKMLCSDIAKALGANYTTSNSRANINKTEESPLKKIFHRKDKMVVDPNVLKQFALGELNDRLEELKQKETTQQEGAINKIKAFIPFLGNKSKAKKIEALKQLILDITNSPDLIPTLQKFVEDKENKSTFSSQSRVGDDKTFKLINEIIKEYEYNKKLIEANKQKEQALQQDDKKPPKEHNKQQVQELKIDLKEQQNDMRLIQESLAQQKKSLDHEINHLHQLKSELVQVKKDLKNNSHKLAEIKTELTNQNKELNDLSTKLSNEEKAAHQINVTLKQEIKLIDQLKTTLNTQQLDLPPLEEKLAQQKEQIASITDQINNQKETLNKLMTSHQAEKDKLNNLSQLQKETSILGGLTQNLNEEKSILASGNSELIQQITQKESLSTQLKNKVHERQEIQLTINAKEANRWLISKLISKIFSFIKSIFSSSGNKSDPNNPVTQISSEINQVLSDIIKLDKNIEQQKQTVQIQKDKVDQLETGIVEQTKKVQSIQNHEEQTKKVTQLESNITQTKLEIEKLEQTKPSEDEIQRLEEKIKQQKQVISETESTIKAKSSSIENQQENLITKNKAIKDMKQHIVDKHRSINEIEKSMHVHENTIKNDKITLHSLNDTIIKQKDTIQEQEKKLQGQEEKGVNHNPVNQSISMKQKLTEAKNKTIEGKQEKGKKIDQITP